VGAELSLADAQAIAQENNPILRKIVVARRNAGMAVSTAYGGWLPQLTTGFGAAITQAGSEVLEGVSFALPGTLNSYYNIGLSYELSADRLFAPGAARANRDAADADIGGQTAALRGAVAQQYLAVLQAEAKAALQDTLVADLQLQLEVARIRQTAGAATPLETRSAEIKWGQRQVDALEAHNDAASEMARLFQQLGIAQPDAVQLTTTFDLIPLDISLDSVLALAGETNPDLTALRARTHAATVEVHRAHGRYAPTLVLSTGLSGYTYQYTNANVLVGQYQQSAQQTYSICLASDSAERAAYGYPPSCSGLLLTPSQIAQIRSQNRTFPFNFTSAPYAISASLSLPLFDGLAREQTVERAEAAEDDARYDVRARELQLTADITTAYHTLTTALRAAQLQQENAAKARDELLLAEQRYRVGASGLLDVTDARAGYEQAETDRINAVYGYHKAFAALESAVGHALQ
jgi:outer membrane protein